MLVNFNSNYPQPQFGKFCVHRADKILFREYANMGHKNKITRWAVKHLIKEQGKIRHSEMTYNINDDSITLTNKANGIKHVYENTRHTKLEAMGKTFRNRVRTFFNPIYLVPENMYDAHEDSKILEKILRNLER